MNFLLWLVAVGGLAALLALRLWVVLRLRRKKLQSVKMLVVAGSGGHTTEILRLLGSLSKGYNPRHYVLADTDKMSATKINLFEEKRAERDSESWYKIHHIPRSREVQQSWSSSLFTTLYAVCYSLPLTFRLKPDLNGKDKIKTVEKILKPWEEKTVIPSVLCNGPGTCVPICVSALLLGILGIKKVIIVYVESICRVETLSLSGKILYHFSDYFFVQWPALKEKYPKSVYCGRIV
ncbi:UDP-N-acetylglucosamine transferase subunit ALG14 isoform X1 [Macrotis lagotis]|uniref:UDP-N-acetylglucosamine transferase subunit ALG14 isoform X1 n=1 Tax=Macrotis lagotis TaxID=92651 RepID=UPI003D68DD4C